MRTASEGVVLGEVYDDRAGLPLAGASVALTGTDSRGTPYGQTTITDARGRYALPGIAGSGVLVIGKAGWTSSYRAVTLVGGRPVEAVDARVTRLADLSNEVSAVLGGVVAQGGAELVVPGGGLHASARLTLTRLSQQWLTGILPAGWSPVAAADLGPAAVAFDAPVTLRLPIPAGYTAGAPLVLAHWDHESQQWRAVVTGQVPAASVAVLEASIAAPGQYAWLLADMVPAAPAQPAAGGPLVGVAPEALPANATTTIDPQPRVIFYKPDVRSDVRGTIQHSGPLSSGTMLRSTITESYAFRSGEEAHPEPYTQDLFFYQVPGVPQTLAAPFGVMPSLTFEALSLERGVIGVELRAPQAGVVRAGVSGPEGGTVGNDEGDRVDVPAGAVSALVPVDLQRVTLDDIGIGVPPGFEFAGAVALSLSGVTLAAPAVLSIPRPAAMADGSQFVVAQVVAIHDTSRLALVALGRSSGARVLSETALAGDPDALPGIRESGRYVVLRAITPIGFARGRVDGVGGSPFQGALLSSEGVALVSLSRGGGAYASALPVGAATLTALDLDRADTASGAVTLGAPAQVVPLNLRLIARTPRVTAIVPADGAVNVPLSNTVVVTFSEPVDPTTVTGQTITLAAGTGATVSGTVTLAADNTVATFRPAQPLATDTHYTLTVAGAIADTSGYPIGSATIARFTSLDTTAPPPPAAGAISATVPDAGGVLTISSTQGIADPHDTVSIVNVTRNTFTPVLLNPNGGFVVQAPARLGERLRVRIVDQAGNATFVDLTRFRQINPDGSV